MPTGKSRKRDVREDVVHAHYTVRRQMRPDEFKCTRHLMATVPGIVNEHVDRATFRENPLQKH